MNSHVHERGDRWSAPLWYVWECQGRQVPAVIIHPKRLYASIVVNVGTARRVFTSEGYFDLMACFQRHSQGVKHWSAAGGHRIVQCVRVPIDHAEACADEIIRSLDAWTEPSM